MLSGQQNKLYRPLVRAAWLVHCLRTGHDPKNKAAHNDWYRKELVNNFHVYTTLKINLTVETFDALCLHFATLAGNDKQIGYWASAPENRALFVLHKILQGANLPWSYALGIAKKMGFLRDDGSSGIEDLPAEMIRKINNALFYHLKRNRKREAQAA